MTREQRIKQLREIFKLYDFSLYGNDQGASTVADLNGDDYCLLARAEYSGCEGCFVEVARTDCTVGRQPARYAFTKVFGGEVAELITGSRETAQLIADAINKLFPENEDGFIHNLPNWTPAVKVVGKAVQP